MFLLSILLHEKWTLLIYIIQTKISYENYVVPLLYYVCCKNILLPIYHIIIVSKGQNNLD